MDPELSAAAPRCPTCRAPEDAHLEGCALEAVRAEIRQLHIDAQLIEDEIADFRAERAREEIRARTAALGVAT